ncbi:MAG: helix-turn-helix transcriptional regulator [Clostridia bacterium]|nr:helix-turn-helix transcriptional regulator [Clostridia bacterium]
MELETIFNSSEKSKKRFEVEEGNRPWDIFLVIGNGRYTLSFPDLDETYTVGPFEASYIPKNTTFTRRILEPIDFHQFVFQCHVPNEAYKNLTRGTLGVPEAQIQAFLASADKLSEIADSSDFVSHMIERLITESYIFSKQGGKCARGLSVEVSETIRYMTDHLSEKLDMGVLAARVYLSHAGLIGKFKKELDTTPVEYLIMLRLRKAKQLLLEGELPIGVIAERCGYANAYYFTNAFRHYAGMSPTAFRKQYR